MKIFSKPQKDGGGKSGVPGDKSGNFITYHVTDDKGTIIYTGKVRGRSRFNDSIEEYKNRIQENIHSGPHVEPSEKSAEQIVRDSKNKE